MAAGAERKPLSGVVAMASLVCGEVIQLGPGSVVEDCDIRGPVEVGDGCVLAGLQHTGSERLSVESDLVLHRLPVRLAALTEDGVAGVVSRLYGVLDNPKTPLSDVGATFLNRPWRAWLDAAGIPKEVLWGDMPPEECTLWNARLYPLASDPWASWKAVAWMQRPEQATEEEKEGWRHSRRLSLEESYLCADLERVVSEARALEDEIRAKRFLQAIREEQFSEEAAVLLGERSSMVRRWVERVIGMSEREEDALLRMRAWKSTADSLARVAGEDEEARTWADSLEEKAFGTLADGGRRTSVWDRGGGSGAGGLRRRMVGYPAPQHRARGRSRSILRAGPQEGVTRLWHVLARFSTFYFSFSFFCLTVPDPQTPLPLRSHPLVNEWWSPASSGRILFGNGGRNTM